MPCSFCICKLYHLFKLYYTRTSIVNACESSALVDIELDDVAQEVVKRIAARGYFAAVVGPRPRDLADRHLRAGHLCDRTDKAGNEKLANGMAPGTALSSGRYT